MEIFPWIFFVVCVFFITLVILLTLLFKMWENLRASTTLHPPPFPAYRPQLDIDTPSTSGLQNPSDANPAFSESSGSYSSGAQNARGAEDKPPSYAIVVKSQTIALEMPFPEVSPNLLKSYPPTSDEGHSASY